MMSSKPTLSGILLGVFAFMLPFEIDQPLVVLGPIAISNIELGLGFILLLAIYEGWRHPIRPNIPKSWCYLGVIFLSACLLSALFAAELRTNALKAALRTASGVALVPAVVILLAHKANWWPVLGGLCAGCVLAMGLGSAELIVDQPLAMLNSLRVYPSTAGPTFRLTGPFDYTNQAAMYAEAVAPLLLVGALWLWQQRRQASALILAAGFVLTLQSAILTYSRSSVVTLLLLFGAVALLHLWRGERQTSLAWLGAILTTVMLFGLTMMTDDIFNLRYSTASDQSWYDLTLNVPADLTIQPDESIAIPLTIANESPRAWTSSGKNPIFIGARWVHIALDAQVAEPRWALPAPLTAASTLDHNVVLTAPPLEGAYLLYWDLVEENIAWFEQKNGLSHMSFVQVGDGNSAEFDTSQIVLSKQINFKPPDPNRLVLWQTAFSLWLDSPLLGVGLDNYRLLFGPELGLSRWNDTLHSNNWYIETVVSLGAVGGLVFLGWMALLATNWLTLARISGRSDPNDKWRIGIAAALAAFFIHGLLDYFLLFNSVGLLFWLLVGAWLAFHPTTQGRSL